MNAQLMVEELARDIQHAIADDGYAPLSPTDYNGLRDTIKRVLTPDRIAALAAPKEAGDAGEVAFWRDVYERTSYSMFRARGEDSIRARECARADVESRQRECDAMQRLANPPGDQRQVWAVLEGVSPDPELFAEAFGRRDDIDAEVAASAYSTGVIDMRHAAIEALAAPTGPQPAGGGVDGGDA